MILTNEDLAALSALWRIHGGECAYRDDDPDGRILARLAGLGFVTVTDRVLEPGPVTVHCLTEAGRWAVKHWRTMPAHGLPHRTLAEVDRPAPPDAPACDHVAGYCMTSAGCAVAIRCARPAEAGSGRYNAHRPGALS
ncbi:hypothetical protein [Oceanibacterium hippocampi]|uniref:Uncharacterized protein n=1 Tax=Oceanibacterium hippocampi TaxID=745714 RepID=A0A1Y5TZI5_9PROT|nr:hypothetical protein [Oceanibacterium hippocampi]SLN77541.1 hypothetical protein OCH7691_04452 [Oceanibacterium hippocampi]